MKSDRELTLRCPECYQECGWCSWYVMNAREAGCGCRSPRGKPGCEKAEALRGTKCGTCDGSGIVKATITQAAAIGEGME